MKNCMTLAGVLVVAAVLGGAGKAEARSWTVSSDVLQILQDTSNEGYLGRVAGLEQWYKRYDLCGPSLRDAINRVHTDHVYQPGTSIGVGGGKPDGIKVGDGQCVAFTRAASNAPGTWGWRPGRRVISGGVSPGTVIATFSNGKYSGHTTVLKEYRTTGIAVWHQNYGVQAVTTAVIPRTNSGGVADAASYYVVETD